MKPSIARIRSFFDQTHRDDSGAVALLCLAAVLALMLVAWMILDVQTSTRDKVMLQGAADTAAFSHASVEARSMNMISYANIAKRSVVGIHSLYPSMMAAYLSYIAVQAGICIASYGTKFDACLKAGAHGWLAGDELLGDHTKFSGNPLAPYLDAGLNAVMDVLDFIGLDIDTGSLSSGNVANAHAKDLQALDNYQHYMLHVTPWWAWSEQLSRGWRNGATTVASFPPPPGDITVTLSAVEDIINQINPVLAALGAPEIDLDAYHGNDNLPITKQGYTTSNWLCQMFMGLPSCSLGDLSNMSLSDLSTSFNESYIVEHLANVAVHEMESDIGDVWIGGGEARAAVLLLGPTFFFVTVGLQFTEQSVGDQASPYVIDTGTITDEAAWLEHTSNLVFAYSNDPTRMDEARAKYSVPSEEYELSGNIVDELIYGSSGYWTMSKSEITYNGGGIPDMWHPSWTARMRPVHLPGEFEDADYNMNTAYNQALPYLALSAQVASINGGAVDSIVNSIRDFALMEASTAAMGPSTAEGIAK